MEEIVLDSVDQIFETLRLSNTREFGDIIHRPWLFRGHRDAAWRLLPHTWREDFFKSWEPAPFFPGLVEDAAKAVGVPFVLAGLLHSGNLDRQQDVFMRLLIEFQLLRNFELLANSVAVASTMPQTLRDVTGDYESWLRAEPKESWVLAQHYGIPTRLLDWTRDPLTALYFALEGSSGESAVWAIDTDGQKEIPERSDPLIKLHFIESPPIADPRVKTQSSVFSYVALGERRYLYNGQYPTPDMFFAPFKVRKYVLRLSDVELKFAKRNLYLENKTRAHLMPDLGSCAEVAKDFYRSNLQL